MKRRATIVTVIIALVLLVVAFRLVQVKRGNVLAEQAVGDLLNALKDNDQVRVEQLLGEEARQQFVSLKSLSILTRATNPHLSTEPSAMRRFLSNQVTVTVPLITAAGQETLAFMITEAKQTYLVSSLPAVVAHPAALVSNAASSTATLAAYSIDHEVTTPKPLLAGEVGLAVSIDLRLVHFSPANITPVGRALRYTRGGPFEGELRVGNLARDAAFYSVVEGATPEVLWSLLPGTPGVGVVEWDGSIYAAVATERFVPDNVRVVLNTTDYLKLTHSEVTLSSAAGLRLRDKIGNTSLQVPPFTVVRLTRVPQGLAVTYLGQEKLVASHRIFAEPLTGTGRTTLHNVRRALGIPAYRGVIEVNLSGQPQGLIVVNEVALNEYLYSVVPSEMPVSFGLEALKAQALAARAYAVAGIISGGYTTWGAHVEDSVMSQVYNNVQENQASTAAVNATNGLIPIYAGQVVDARFFSTSSGYTANHHEVWSDGSRFPGKEIPYLVARAQNPQVTALRDEAAVRSFLARKDINAPEADAPYFRWSVSFTRAELEAVINHNLPNRLAAQPSFVTKTAGDGSLESGIGTLEDIVIISRGQGGNIMELEVVGSLNSCRITKEYNVRTLLRPIQYIAGRSPIRLQLNNGATVSNYSLLPSAFAYFEFARNTDGNIERVTIRGGGNGHGVGLSQTGARGLALTGLDYAQIIAHYYPGSTIADVSDLFQ